MCIGIITHPSQAVTLYVSHGFVFTIFFWHVCKKQGRNCGQINEVTTLSYNTCDSIKSTHMQLTGCQM